MVKGLKPNPRAISQKKKSKGFEIAMKNKNTQPKVTGRQVNAPYLSKKKTKKLKHKYA